MNLSLNGFDALLITNPVNIRYFTGFLGAAPEERESYLLVTKNKKYLFTNSLYREAAKKLASEFVEISRDAPLSEKLEEIVLSEKIKRLGFEEENLTVAEFQKLKKELNGIALVPTKNRIEDLRMIKREDEIANIRAAAKLTDQCFTYLVSFLKPGVTESQISWEIESFFRTRGADCAFSPTVAFGAHTSQPHYQAARYHLAASQGGTLQRNDMVLFDFGARVNGYCSDMTRTIFIGTPRGEWKRAYQAVLNTQQAVLDEILHILIYEEKQRATGAMLDRLAGRRIREFGFTPYPHSLGHGVGLAIHEQPRLSYKKDVALKPGMVVTVEPAIYIEGRYGIRIEDLVLLKKEGIEILSKSPKQLIIL